VSPVPGPVEHLSLRCGLKSPNDDPRQQMDNIFNAPMNTEDGGLRWALSGRAREVPCPQFCLVFQLVLPQFVVHDSEWAPCGAHVAEAERP